MRTLEVEVKDKFVMSSNDVETYINLVRLMCLVQDFDLDKPIKIRVNHDKLSVSYLQDREDL